MIDESGGVQPRRVTVTERPWPRDHAERDDHIAWGPATWRCATVVSQRGGLFQRLDVQAANFSSGPSLRMEPMLNCGGVAATAAIGPHAAFDVGFPFLQRERAGRHLKRDRPQVDGSTRATARPI